MRFIFSGRWYSPRPAIRAVAELSNIVTKGRYYQPGALHVNKTELSTSTFTAVTVTVTDGDKNFHKLD